MAIPTKMAVVSGLYATVMLLVIAGTVRIAVMSEKTYVRPKEEAGKQIPLETLKLHQPTLPELASVLETGLKEIFSNVEVQIVDCPDLSIAPFYLATQGIAGRPSIADIGAEIYLVPTPDKSKIYDFRTIAEQINFPDVFMMGAGAGPFRVVGTASEYIANLKFKQHFTETVQKSFVARINKTNGNYDVFPIPSSTEFAFMMNLFVSEGKPGKVIEVKASKRFGSNNFFSQMRESIKNKYPDVPVGVGGVFLMKSGTATLHVQGDFSEIPLDTPQAVNDWLKFFNMSAPLVCPGVFISYDPGYKLRMEHSHCFSYHGDAGHYHYDVTPDEAEYLGYYLPGESLYRFDKPES